MLIKVNDSLMLQNKINLRGGANFKLPKRKDNADMIIYRSCFIIVGYIAKY
jgi:hypothetical protein